MRRVVDGDRWITKSLVLGHARAFPRPDVFRGDRLVLGDAMRSIDRSRARSARRSRGTSLSLSLSFSLSPSPFLPLSLNLSSCPGPCRSDHGHRASATAAEISNLLAASEARPRERASERPRESARRVRTQFNAQLDARTCVLCVCARSHAIGERKRGEREERPARERRVLFRGGWRAR